MHCDFLLKIVIGWSFYKSKACLKVCWTHFCINPICFRLGSVAFCLFRAWFNSEYMHVNVTFTANSQLCKTWWVHGWLYNGDYKPYELKYIYTARRNADFARKMNSVHTLKFFLRPYETTKEKFIEPRLPINRHFTCPFMH